MLLKDFCLNQTIYVYLASKYHHRIVIRFYVTNLLSPQLLFLSGAI